MLDEINFHLAELYVTVTQDGGDEATYQKKTEAIVGDENCYKFMLVRVLCFYRMWIFEYYASKNNNLSNVLLYDSIKKRS